MFGYHIPDPDQAMLVSGSKSKDRNTPFKIVTGHGKWVLPVKNRVSYLTLAMQEAEVHEQCVTQQGVALQVKAVIAFKVGNDAESVTNAATRFLSDESQMPALTGRIFAGHLRSIVGSLTVEDLIRERQKLAEEVLSASKSEMARLGLIVDSLQIESIDDMGSGYIQALAQPHVAAVNQLAAVAQAEADRASAEAQQRSASAQADYARQTSIAKAQYQAEVDQAQSKASQAGPLAQAEAQQQVLSEQAKVAERNAELRTEQLKAEVIAPAEAEATRVRTIAQAEADRTRVTAEAAASNGRIALDQQIIDALPQMVLAVANGMAQANVTILNGAEGYGEVLASLAGQATAILRAAVEGVKQAPPAGVTSVAADGSAQGN